MRSSRLALACVIIVIAISVLESLRGAALREAEAQASLRLLAKFHSDFLTRKGVSLEEYRRELEAFQHEHAGFQHLELYAGWLETERPKVSDDAEALLRIAEDKDRPLKERGDAAAELGRFKEGGVIERLSRLLPGGYDVLTLEVINALGEIGDPRALPALERVKSGGNQPVDIPGKINAVLEWAIRRCQP
jgi:hypothetical protein